MIGLNLLGYTLSLCYKFLLTNPDSEEFPKGNLSSSDSLNALCGLWVALYSTSKQWALILTLKVPY